MNKLRLIKIYEIKGKVHPLEEFMIVILNGLKEVHSINYNSKDIIIETYNDKNIYFIKVDNEEYSKIVIGSRMVYKLSDIITKNNFQKLFHK